MKEDFVEVLERIQEGKEEFKVICDVMPVKTLGPDPIDALFTYLQESGKELADVLGVEEDCPNKLLTREEFHTTLQVTKQSRIQPIYQYTQAYTDLRVEKEDKLCKV